MRPHHQVIADWHRIAPPENTPKEQVEAAAQHEAAKVQEFLAEQSLGRKPEIVKHKALKAPEWEVRASNKHWALAVDNSLVGLTGQGLAGFRPVGRGH